MGKLSRRYTMSALYLLSDGNGNEFKFGSEVPMHQHPDPRLTQAARSGRKTAEPTTQKDKSCRKVFLFEDDNAIRRLLTRLIEENGFDVLDFSSPRQLINDVEKAHLLKQHDIVITDIKIPGMSGMELVNLLVRAGFNPGRIAIMSGHWMEGRG